MADAGAEDAVAASPLLGIKGRRLAAVGGEGEVGAQVEGDPAAVDAFVRDPFEDIEAPDLQVEVVEGPGVLQVAVQKIAVGLVGVNAAISEIGPSPAIEVKGEALALQVAAVYLQELVAWNGRVAAYARRPEEGYRS